MLWLEVSYLERLLETYLSEQELQLLNPKHIQTLIKRNLPICITTYRLTPVVKQYLRKVTTLFLHEANQEGLEEYLTFCIAELIDNSQKANAKRIYFREQNLDIFDFDDYNTGMKNFKKDFMSRQNYYQSLQEEKGLSITMTLEMRGDFLYLEIKNNTELTVFEYKRIHDKIMRALQSKNPSQLLTYIDETEGAGLGFISITCMLLKFNLTEESIEIASRSDSTAIKIKLPLNMEEHQYLTAISQELSETLQSIPQLPENVSKISGLLDDPTSDLMEIIALIQQDVALSTNLLKLVNSASFRMKKTPTSIEESVKMVGLRGVKNLIYAISSIHNLTPTTKNKKNLWQHSLRVGTYALVLAYKFYGTNKQITADAYVCGLLHDIGKILFEAAHPETLRILSNLCDTKGIPPRIFEKIVTGANHAEIGALITKKWNFPEVITTAIQFHHSPAAAPEKHRKIVDIVYLANAIFHYQSKNITFAQMDSSTLNNLGITKEEQITALVRELAIE